jgi:hypothetical protein
MFIIILLIINLPAALYVSIVVGVGIIVLLSYNIAIKQKVNPYKAIINHLLITAIVIIISFLLKEWIAEIMPKLVRGVV